MLHFSARLDETDTHDYTLVTVVGGAVGTIAQWECLENDWGSLLGKAKVNSFHWKEFVARQKEFSSWGDLKAKRFQARLEKAIDNNVGFRIAVGVDSTVHADVKRRMKGIKGFRGDSDYGLCLRWLLHHSCDVISNQFGDEFTVSVIVEDGPYAAGAVALFRDLTKMTGSFRPAKFAHHYGDIAVRGKESRSLQAADAIAGMEADRLGRPGAKRSNRLSVLLNRPLLEKWYEGMMAEKERRRAFGVRNSPTSAF